MTKSPKPDIDWTRLPWFEHPMPNWDLGRTIESIDVEALDQGTFKDQYWARNRPLLIKGAAKHTDAVRKWASVDYLRAATVGANVAAMKIPVVEREPENDEKRFFHRATIDGMHAIELMSMSEFWDRMTAPEADPLFLYAEALPEGLAEGEVPLGDEFKPPRPDDPEMGKVWDWLETATPLYGLEKDFGRFDFVSAYKGGRYYRRRRLFVYRRSFTDWHAHPADAHLMIQFRGDKFVALMEPNAGMRFLQPVLDRRRHSYLATPENEPDYFTIRPFCVRVEEGDALHLPIYWWHAVAAAGDEFGITGAFTWQSPGHVQGDWYFGHTRMLHDYLSLPMKIGFLGLRGWSRAYRAWRRLSAGEAENWEWRHGD